jgi:transcriptional regulator with XRE-family HTH domain
LQELLSQIRVEAGLRQVDLAERFGEPQSFVSQLRSASDGWTHWRFGRFWLQRSLFLTRYSRPLWSKLYSGAQYEPLTYCLFSSSPR